MKIVCMPRGGRGGSEAVYSLLEYVIRREYGISLPPVAKTAHGKPYFPGRPDIHFSLSHAASHVLCAVAAVPVGVDIESPRDIRGRVIRRFATEDELALFDPLDLWVLKESFIKLTDGTLLPSVLNLRFSMDGGKITSPDPKTVSRLYRTSGCRAAACALGGGLPADIEYIGAV